MTTYNLYQSRNTITPFMTVSPDSIDDTSTSLYFIGQNLVGYGQIEQQDTLWLLENFANTVAPSNMVLGQEFFNTTDNMMYVCTNETGPVLKKVSQPLVSSSAPSYNLTHGDLWYNTTNSTLYAYNGSIWTIIGPTSGATSLQTITGFSATTSNAVPTEMFVNGVSSNRLIIPADSSWVFDVVLVGRVEETISEVIAIEFKGVLDRPDSGPASILGGIQQQVYNKTGTLNSSVTATVAADAVHNSLLITVTGETGSTINWSAVCSAVSVANT